MNGVANCFVPSSTSSIPPRLAIGIRVFSEREKSRPNNRERQGSPAAANPPLPAPRTAIFLMDMDRNLRIEAIVFQFVLVQFDAKAGFCGNQNITIAIAECVLNDIVLVVNPSDALLTFVLRCGNRDETTESHRRRRRRQVNVCRLANTGFERAVKL